MTAKQIFEGLLTELSKVNAPSMLLQDFNYFFNKVINQYVNKRYNIYDVNQQTTDDLRVLKSTAILTPEKADEYDQTYSAGRSKLFGATYKVYLPDDYLHMLNCICVYKLNKNHKCYNKNDYVQFAAKRLTADAWSIIVNDYYNRPLPERPYYYIHNVNTSDLVPTNPETDMVGDYNVPENSNLPRTIVLNGSKATANAVEKETAYRYGNASKVRCEIRYGRDDTVFELQKVLIDYIKAPQYIRLTQEQIDMTEDTSQIMEFPDYVCQEIINELVHVVMENTADPRLQTHIPVTQSIATPAQQQAQQKS